MNCTGLDRRGFFRSGGAAIAGAAFIAAAPSRQTTAVRLNVTSARAQRFDGFGLSQPRADTTFVALPAKLQDEALDLAYKSLPVDYFRAWVPSASAWEVPRMVYDFKQSYIDNGFLAKILARCHAKLLLAPGTGNEGQTIAAWDYGRKIAEFISTIRSETGLVFEATGVLNEPAGFSNSYLADAAFYVRRELDARGLQGMKVIASDWANVDGLSIQSLGFLQANNQANTSIHAWSHHSYNLGSTHKMALASQGKPRWVTEAGQGVGDSQGSKAIVNAMDGPVVAAKVINDLNQGVTRWMYFIGLQNEAARPAPGASRHALVVASTATGIFAFNRYFYLKQLLATFPRGSVFHPSTSSLDGTMDWSWGQKPRMCGACAEGPDGRLRLAAVNTTGIVNSNIAKYYAAQTLALELDLPWPGKKFHVYITGTDGKTRSAGIVQSANGQTGLVLNPFELATLVEA